jgi:1,4-alpha-glucan branching enzyme
MFREGLFAALFFVANYKNNIMKIRLLGMLLFVFAFAKAQVSTIPSTPTPVDQVRIVFDATGTPLENVTETLRLYSGVTINGMEFQQTPSDFFSNDPDDNPAFTRTGQNSYFIDLGPSLNEYYGVANDEVITAIDLVIRVESGSPQTEDYKLTVFEPGLNAVLTSPEDGTIIPVNTTLTLSGDSSVSADLTLTVNNDVVASTNGTTISTTFNFAASGSYTVSIDADNGTEVASDERTVFVPAATVEMPRPAGLLNGVNERDNGDVTFLLAAPGKSDVNLIGSFNGYALTPETQMFKDGNYFWLTIPAARFTAGESFTYQYLVDFDIKVADPYSTLILDPGSDRFIKPGNFPNLPAYPTEQTEGDVTLYTYQEEEYNWQVTDFERPDKENLVIYELLVRDFSEDDSYQAVIDRIDYIVDLGVNAVEFMPVNEFEGTDSWGYNPKFHGALDKAYGPPEKFKELVDLLHANGIAVIIDIVYNHAFSQSPLAQMWWDQANFRPSSDSPYLNPVARHPFNVGFDFNHESTWTRQYVKQTSQYFLDEYKVDGFRYDLSKGFTQTNTGSDVGAWGRLDQSRINILNDYRTTIEADNDNEVYLILEHLSDNDEEKVLADAGFMLWGKMTDQYKENSLGFSNGTNVFRSYFLSRGFNDQHLVAYAESHDEQRLMYDNLQFGNSSNPNHNVKSLPVALARQEAIAAILYSIPGPKMLWQFGELGYEIDIDENGRTGRKPVPFSLNYQDNTDRAELFEATSEMIKLKVKYPEIFNSRDNNLDVSGLIKRINLNGPDFDAVVVANFNVTNRDVTVNFSETGTWYEFFSGDVMEVTNTSTNMNIEPGGYRVFSTQPLTTTASNEDVITSSNSIQVYPNPTRDSFSVSEDVQQVLVFNLAGQLVKRFDQNLPEYSINELASGVYIVNISSAIGTENVKLVKF